MKGGKGPAIYKRPAGPRRKPGPKPGGRPGQLTMAQMKARIKSYNTANPGQKVKVGGKRADLVRRLQAIQSGNIQSADMYSRGMAMYKRPIGPRLPRRRGGRVGVPQIKQDDHVEIGVGNVVY